jgi:hypothetical protein
MSKYLLNENIFGYSKTKNKNEYRGLLYFIYKYFLKNKKIYFSKKINFNFFLFFFIK